MLKRELDYAESTVYTPLHRCQDLGENTFYVHIINGIPVHSNENNIYHREEVSLSGGILCDEMGLGKTMCVLLTSLLNKCPKSFLASNIFTSFEEDPQPKRFKSDDPSLLPCLCGKIPQISVRRPNSILICSQCSRSIHKACVIQNDINDQSFICPYCEQRSSNHQELLPTGATLIIAPAAILHQWIEEIDKHIRCPLKIYIYESIVNHLPVPDRQFLAKQDFIFCSYENLKKDIHHNEICSKEHHATRKHVRKYEYLISPLLRLKYWRLGKRNILFICSIFILLFAFASSAG